MKELAQETFDKMDRVVRNSDKEDLKDTAAIYYRAVPEYLGKKTIFQPKGYSAEYVDKDENLVLKDGEPICDPIPSICGSHTISGSVLGVFTMLAYHQKIKKSINTKVYIYKIAEKPFRDLSHLTTCDFKYLQEVRWISTITGFYIGWYQYNFQFYDKAYLLYQEVNKEMYNMSCTLSKKNKRTIEAFKKEILKDSLNLPHKLIQYDTDKV